MIEYGVTHCPHCEKPFASAEEREAYGVRNSRYCYGTGVTHIVPTCDLLTVERHAHLVAVLQERDALRAELAQVHAGQLSLLVGGA